MGARLARDNRQLRALLDAVPQLLYVKDAEGRYVFVNRAFAELVGRPIENVLGRTLKELRRRRRDRCCGC